MAIDVKRIAAEIELQNNINSMNIPHSCGKTGCSIKVVNQDFSGSLCGKKINETDVKRSIEDFRKRVNLFMNLTK